MKTEVVLKDISLISVLEIDKHFRPDKILKRMLEMLHLKID